MTINSETNAKYVLLLCETRTLNQNLSKLYVPEIKEADRWHCEKVETFLWKYLSIKEKLLNNKLFLR